MEVELLNAAHITFGYPSTPNRVVLRDWSTRICRGDIIKVVGSNGSGKSTALRILAGDLKPTSGVVHRNVHLSRTMYLDQFAARITAADLTVGEQLLVAGQIGSGNGGQPIDALAMMVRFAGISGELGSFVGHLSGGQRQIVALLTALGTGAEVLLLDEFTAFMDEASVATSLAILHEVIELGTHAIVYAGHDEIQLTATATINFRREEQ